MTIDNTIIFALRLRLGRFCYAFVVHAFAAAVLLFRLRIVCKLRLLCLSVVRSAAGLPRAADPALCGIFSGVCRSDLRQGYPRGI